MNDYYDREGKVITAEQWADLHKVQSYMRIDETYIGEARVSTIWLGVNHNWIHGEPPIIFETMIFNHPVFEGDMARYSTEEQAIEGHNYVVAVLKELL